MNTVDTPLRSLIILLLISLIICNNDLISQTIPEYVVHKSLSTLKIYGKLTEPEWQNAAVTQKFVLYVTGAAARLSTRAKFLWDDKYLYIGFICEDPDVWATMTKRDDLIYKGEVVEIICDPDGDGLNYFEFQVNPLGTILDLLLNKPYSKGGVANLTWNLDSAKIGVWVDGTLNNLDSVDVQWNCEVALPFKDLAFMGPILHFPPAVGESWRILVTRYDYERTGKKDTMVCSWNQTDSRGFHVPEKFGRIIFSDSLAVPLSTGRVNVVQPISEGLVQNYPNPFNPRTTIDFAFRENGHGRVAVYDLLGREIAALAEGEFKKGVTYRTWFDGTGKGSGVYFIKVSSAGEDLMRKIVLMK